MGRKKVGTAFDSMTAKGESAKNLTNYSYYDTFS